MGQTDKVYEASRHPKASQQRLTATTQTNILPSLARTQSERHSFNNTLQRISKPGLKLGPLGRGKTLSHHLEQLRGERRSALSAHTTCDRFRHRSVTVGTAAEAVASPMKEFKEKAFKASVEACGKGRRVFSLHPDWPRSRQLICSLQRQVETVQ